MICRDTGSDIGQALGNASPPFPEIACDPMNPENLSVASALTETSDIIIHRGDRLALPYFYADTAFGIANDAAIADATTVGTVKARINVACDAVDDLFIDNTSTSFTQFAGAGVVPEPMFERTTAFDSTSGLGGRSEEFLDEVLPSFPKVVRYRADVDFVTLGGSPMPLANTVSLNNVVLDLPWGDSRVNATLVGGDPNAPSAQLELCLDSPLSSSTNMNLSAGLTNPANPGLYAVWATQLSAPGTRDETLNHFSIATSCKQIGGSFADSDNDCWDDSDDTNTGDRDQDDDGLLDGIEVSWGSNPNIRDTDGDGRTDLEEMIGPANLLTNPTIPDTDADGFIDAGYIADCDGDGIPDGPASPVHESAGNGRNRTIVTLSYCKENGTNVLNTPAQRGGRPWGNPGAASFDNCPSLANVSQLNSANTDVDLSFPPGDSNDRFNGTRDISHPNGRFTGDACEPDDDNDGVPDVVEGNLAFDPTGGITGDNFCNMSGAGSVISLIDTNRDSDTDGSEDGFECQMGANPVTSLSKPGNVSAAIARIFFRFENLSLEDGTVILNIEDTDGAFPTQAQARKGLSPASRDTDRDGCADAVEAADVDGNGAVTIADVLAVASSVFEIGAFAPPGSRTADELRTGDFDGNGASGVADWLGVARVYLSVPLPSVLDYQILCIVSQNGYLPN